MEGSHTELLFSLAPHDSDETLRASEIERGFRLKRRFSFVTFSEHSEGSSKVEESLSELLFFFSPHDSDETLHASETERGFRLKRRFSFVTFS